MAMTLEELRRKAGTSAPGTQPAQAKTQLSAPTMTLDELRRKAGTTAPVRPARVQPQTSQPAQTAGESSPAVSYADKLKEKQSTQKYGLIDGKVVLPSYIDNQGLYAAPGTEKSKVNYLMESAAKGLAGGVLQTGEAIWQDLSGDAGKAERAYYDYVMESAYNPQKAGRLAEYQTRKEEAAKNEKLNTDTLGYKLLESSQQDMAKATEGMGQVGQFMAGVGGTVLENAYLMPLYLNPVTAPVAPFIMAASAAGKMIKEQADKGKSLDKARVRGAVEGTIEYLTSKMGMDAVASLITGQGDNVVKEVLRSVISEAGEEGLSYSLGTLADWLEDKTGTKWDWKELGLNMLAGGLAGGVLGGGGAVVGNIGSTMGSNTVQLPNPQAGITQMAEETGKPFDISALPQATQTVQLPNPINAGIMQTAEAGKPFDISKLPQYRQTIQLPNHANAGVNQQVESGKPFDISTLSQAQKKATPAVSRLKEYINTLSETQGKNAEINLNRKHNNSDVTVAQFVENNADASFYKEGKLYYMEKDGKKLPVKKSMYDYAKYLQSATNTDVGTTETVEEKPTVDTTGYGNAKVIGKKGDVDILDSIPEGWKRFDMQTAPAGYEGVTNGESLFGGKRKHALVARDIDIKKPQAVMPVYNADGQLEQGTLYGSFEADSEEIRLKNKENYVKDTEFLREFIGRDEDADISEINMMYDLHEIVNNSPEYESIKKEFSTEDMKLLKETDADLYEELMDVGNYTPESYDAQINYWNKLGENFKSNEYRKYIDEAIENRKENQAVSKKAAEQIEKAKSSDQMTPQQKEYLSRWDDSEIRSVVRNNDGSITVEHTFEDFDKIVKVNRDGKRSFVDKHQKNEAVADKQVRTIPVASESNNKPKYTSRLSEYLNGFSPMQKAKIEKALNVGYKYDGVPMTRAEFVESKVAQDGNADNFVKTERKAEISNAVKKTIDDAFFGGNENSVKAKLGKYWVDTAETKAFMENPRSESRWKAKAVILENARPVKITYGYNKGDGIRTEITKTEYDFAQWLSAGNNSQNDDSQIKQIDKNYLEGTSKDVSNSLPENKKTEKKARPKKEKAAENKLTDFGEKIGGARKDDWRDRGLDVNDIAGMTDKEKAKFITKDNIWKKPNYEALIKEGKDKNAVYFLKTVRDALPTKPEFRTTNAELAKQVQEEYVKQMREFTDLVMSLDTKEKVMNAFDEVLVKGGYITKDSSRLYAPWHPTEKGKHIFTEKLFNAFRNAEGVNGWRYLSNKVQKDQFGVSSSEKIPKGYSLTEFDDGWAVLKGYKVVSKEFATRESALSWLKENTKKTKNNRFVPPSVERVRREGVDVRKGTEVTGEKLMETYGFRGGEFGNWTNQKERQMNLNFAFDAFHDLARTLGISEKDVALGGKLAIAFGARGKGGAKAAAAHYEPLYEAINLTRMKGAGVLGHEWAHALDDILGTKAIGKAFTKSRGAYQAYDNLLDTMKWRDATADELVEMNEKTKNQYIGYAQSWLNGPFPKSTLDKMTEQQKSEFEALKTAFLSGEKGSVDKLNELHKEVTSRVIPKETRDRLHMYESTWLQPEYGQRTEARVKTDFIKGSEWFDEFESRGEDYWRSDVEIFARAFHTYLLDKTEGVSDYLNAGAEWHALPDLKTGKIYRAYPYGEERTAINKAFDEFFDALKKDGWLTAQQYEAGEMISYSTDGAKVTMEGKIVIEPKKEKAPESPHKLDPKKKAQKKAGNDLPESVGAMKSGYYAAIEEYGAFPEGEKVTNPVDVPMSVDGEHGVTRGVRTIMEAAVTKEDMLADYEKAIAYGEFNYDINRDKDAVEKAVSYIEKYGFKDTYNEWRKKIDNKKEITKDDMVQAQIMYASAVAAGDYDTAMELATDISIEATRAGQVVQSMRVLKKTTPESRLYYAQRSVKAIQEEVNEKYGDKAPTLKVADELLDNLKNAKTDEDIAKATAEINQAIADQLPFSWSNFIASWRYLAMLGNTRTQFRNVLSNCISGIAQEWTNFVQTAGETAFVKAGANIERTSAIKTTEWQRKQAETDFKAIENDLYGKGKFRNDSLTAIQKMQNPFDFKGKGGKAGEIVGKGLTAWNNATNKAMETGDKWFSEPAYKRYYARYLAANKINSEEQLTSKVKLRARAWATKQANESVFRESNALAEWIGKQETQLMNKPIPGARTAAKLVGGLMPFRSTPLNITKRAFEYTPVGIATELGWQVISNKRYGTDYNVTQIINKAAKSFSGTVLIGLGYALAKAGILSGGLDDDKEDDMKKQMGQQEYALNTKNWSMTMDWAGAGMMPLFVGAQMYQMTEEESDGFFMAMLDTLANASAPVMETSMMTGFMSAIKDAKYEDDITKAGMTFLASGLGSYIGQFVPTILGQFSRAIDDTSRTAYTTTKGVIRPLAKAAEKMQNKTPFSVWNVPYMDVWGNDEKNFDFGIGLPGRLLYNMVSPGYIEKKSTDKVEKMLMELYDKTGETSVLPSNYTTSKKVNGENIRFTDKQFEKYTKEYGQTAYDRLDNLFSDKRFNSLTDKEKVKAIEKIYDYSREIASDETVEYELANTDKNRKDALNSGVPSYDVFIGKDIADKETIFDDARNNDSSSEGEAIEYINKHASGLTDIQKAYLFKVIGEDKGFTDEQNIAYVKSYSKSMKEINSNVSKAYATAIYKKANNYARDLAKDKAGVEEMSKSVSNKEAAINYGLSPYYVFEGGDLADSQGNSNGRTSKEEAINYIESIGGLSQIEKAYLFEVMGVSNRKNPYI